MQNVIIATILLSTLSLTFTSLFSSAFRNGVAIENLTEFNTLRQSILTLVQNPALCGESFKTPEGKPLRFPPQGNFEIRLGNTTLAAVGKTIGKGITISGLSLDGINGPTPLSGGMNRYTAFLLLSGERGVKTYGSRNLASANNPLLLNFDIGPAGEIARCGGNLEKGGGGSTSTNEYDVDIFTFNPVNVGTDWKILSLTASYGYLTQMQPFDSSAGYFSGVIKKSASGVFYLYCSTSGAMARAGSGAWGFKGFPKIEIEEIQSQWSNGPCSLHVSVRASGKDLYVRTTFPLGRGYYWLAR